MGQVYVHSLQLSNLISHIFISIFNIFSLIFTLAVLFLLLTKQNNVFSTMGEVVHKLNQTAIIN